MKNEDFAFALEPSTDGQKGQLRNLFKLSDQQLLLDIDHNFYPTEKSLEKLSEYLNETNNLFPKAASFMFLYVLLEDAIEKMGFGVVREGIGSINDETDLEIRYIEVATQGWSGMESIVGTINDTMFRHLYLYQWTRGGLWRYEF